MIAKPPFWHTSLWAALAIAGAALLAYHNSFGVPFVLDDKSAIVSNPSLRSLWTACFPPPDLTGLPVSGRPVVNFSFGLSYAISGHAVWSYHVFNLLIHIASGVVLFGVVRRTLLQPGLAPRFGAQAFELALLTAALWTLHPLQTESVTYISQRAEALLGLLYLLTLWCFIRAVEPGAAPKWARWAFGVCLLGMATKEVMISAPLFAALYDRAFVAGSWREVWKRHRRIHLALASTWLLLAWFVVQEGGARGVSAGFGLGVSWWTYLLTQCDAIVMYLGLALWPHPLVLDYGVGVVQSVADVWWQAAVVVALFAGTLWALVRKPALGCLGAWFFMILAPSSSVIPLVGQTMAEHRMYLPLAAVMVLVVLIAHRWGGSWAMRLMAAVAVLFGILTVIRNYDYRDVTAIWSDTVAKYPQNARAQNNLAWALQQQGNAAEANRHYARAVELQPGYASAHYNWGVALLDQGRVAEAIAQFETAVRLAPAHVDARVNLGNALLQVQRAADALPQYEAALRLKPGSDVHYDLGVALLEVGRPEEAVAHWHAALQMNPDLPAAHYQLARLADKADRLAEAEGEYAATLRLAPDHLEAHRNFGLLLARTGRLAPAAGQFRAVIRLAPADADARGNLGNALLVQGQIREAIACYEESLRLRPNDPLLRENLQLARQSLH